VLIARVIDREENFYRGVIVSGKRSDAEPNAASNLVTETRAIGIARQQEGDQIDRTNTADVVRRPDLVYIRPRVGQTADVPAGHHQP